MNVYSSSAHHILMLEVFIYCSGNYVSINVLKIKARVEIVSMTTCLFDV